MEISAPSAEALQQSFPQFIITGLISAATLPAVYQATSSSGQRQLTIYIVPAAQAATVGWSEPFMNDVAETIKFQHPNLAGISASGISADGQYLYIASEEEPSPSLIQVCLGEGIKTKDALLYIRGLALGLALSHNKGIFHGRLAPSLVSMAGGQIPKIIPFNITPLQTDKSQLEFFAPESLIAGSHRTARTDIYSLGILLYFMLTGKTPSGTGFEMPSNHCKCSDGVDKLTARAINPNPTERFGSCMGLISELETILPGCDTKTVRKAPRQSALPNATDLSKEAAKQRSTPVLYFYLIPALIIGITLAAISVSYRLDMSDASKEVKAIQAESAKIVRTAGLNRKIIIVEPRKKDASNEATSVSETDNPFGSPEPDSTPAPAPAPVVAAPANTDGLTNLCREDGVKARSNEPFKHLSAYDAEKLIDGDRESIAAANPESDKASWFAVDFGKDNERTISRIAIHSPVGNAQLGNMTNFSIKLANSNKDIVAEKDFHTDGTPVNGVEIWNLPEPVKARGLRIESLGKDQALIIGELEVFGKP